MMLAFQLINLALPQAGKGTRATTTVAFNQFVNPWALEAIGWWYYLVYCGWLVFELIFVLWFIVETKGAFISTLRHVPCPT